MELALQEPMIRVAILSWASIIVIYVSGFVIWQLAKTAWKGIRNDPKMDS